MDNSRQQKGDMNLLTLRFTAGRRVLTLGFTVGFTQARIAASTFLRTFRPRVGAPSIVPCGSRLLLSRTPPKVEGK